MPDLPSGTVTFLFIDIGGNMVLHRAASESRDLQSQVCIKDDYQIINGYADA